MQQYMGIIFYLLFFFGVMYLIVFLPQRKREKKTRAMLGALKVNDTVTTLGGVTGKIINIKDDEVTIQTSVERTQINFKKWAIKEVEQPVEA